MGLPSFFYTITLPFILVFSLPLLLTAVITASLSFAILAFRVLQVYAEVAIHIVPFYAWNITLWLAGSPPDDSPVRALSISNIDDPRAGARSPIKYRRKKERYRSSSVNANSTTGSLATDFAARLALTTQPVVARDYEGVGGWRTDVADDEEVLWSKFNSRLELPAEHSRRHIRTVTNGGVRLERRMVVGGTEVGGTSMSNRNRASEMHASNTSRLRSPLDTPYVSDGANNSNSKKIKRTQSSTTMTSLSSTSSKGSVMTIKPR